MWKNNYIVVQNYKAFRFKLYIFFSRLDISYIYIQYNNNNIIKKFSIKMKYDIRYAIKTQKLKKRLV